MFENVSQTFKNSNLNFQRLNNLQCKEIVFSESLLFFFCRNVTLLVVIILANFAKMTEKCLFICKNL